MYENDLFKIFEIAGSSDIGRQLEKNVSSSFLYRGITLAILSLSGKVLVLGIWLIITVSGLIKLLMPMSPYYWGEPCIADQRLK